MRISKRRKSGVEPRPAGSKIRPTQRRPVKAARRRLRATAAELARRKVLHLVAGASALPAMSWSAEAQAYPTRPITMIVPFTAGGTTDVIARILAERMRRSLGQPVVIENVAGAGGSIGTGRVAHARPDGYTVDFGTAGTHVLNGVLYPLQYDVLNEFAPVGSLVTNPVVLFAKNAHPARDLHEMIEWLKANPTKASAGLGGPFLHALTALFAKETGTQFTFVPYRGAAPAVQDLVAGQIDLLFAPGDALPLMRAGSIKAYAVTSGTRLAVAPDLPTFAEMGLPRISYFNWAGLFAPKGTQRDIIDRLNAAAVAALTDATVQSRVIDLGYQAFPREQQTRCTCESRCREVVANHQGVRN
jgi:tripartite-type tricarboxylate transporter receptor subunit TctC